MKHQRVLVLVHKHLVPPEDTSGIDVVHAEWKTEFDVIATLRENGLVHRIESRNAFIACVHNHAAGALVVFLICERCGAVGEASSPEVTATLTSAARAAGFTPKSPVIELTGICTHCRAA